MGFRIASTLENSFYLDSEHSLLSLLKLFTNMLNDDIIENDETLIEGVDLDDMYLRLVIYMRSLLKVRVECLESPKTKYMFEGEELELNDKFSPIDSQISSSLRVYKGSRCS